MNSVKLSASPMESRKSPKRKRVKKEVTVMDDDEDEDFEVKVKVKPSPSKTWRKRRLSRDSETEGALQKVSTPRKTKAPPVVDAVVFTSGDLLDSDDDAAGGKGGLESEAGADGAMGAIQEEETDDRGLEGVADEEMCLTQDSAFQTQETAFEDDAVEVQERRVKPRAASSLPVVFAEKINRSKVILECEGDALDLSGDMGAVGRFTVDRHGSDNELLLDLKGVIYKTTIVPSNTFFVVNVGQTEAKVEAIMSDFVQLRADTDRKENETMVEGTLAGFTFDSDEEGDRPAGDDGDKAATANKDELQEGDDDGKQAKKKKVPAKGMKSGRAPAKKAVAGKAKAGRGKASAKGGGGKKATAKKVTKPRASTVKK